MRLVPPFLIRHGRLRLCSVLACGATLCFILAGRCTPGTDGNGSPNDNGSTDASLDRDHDGIENAPDNCPATANAEQADDDGDGVGDACESPYVDHIAAVTDRGVVEVQLDERRRPTLLVGAAADASFTWAAGSASAEVHTSRAEKSVILSISPDFSDDAILAALDQLAADIGADVTLTRTWIDAHPTAVAAIVSGAETIRVRTPAAGAANSAGERRTARIRQAGSEAVDEYLFGLQVAFAVALVTADDVYDASAGFSGDSDLADSLWDLHWSMVRLEWFLQDLLEDQVRSCEEQCTLACQVDCTISGAGACCTLEGEVPCVDLDAAACEARAGTFWSGFTCADVVCPCEEVECGAVEWGACVLQFGAVSTCGQQARSTCEILGQFYPATSCAQVASPDGACAYTTPEGRVHCADAEPEQCDLILHSEYQAGIYCASGACYYFIDEGVIGCAHLSRADCDNLYVDGELQITDFHFDALCVGASE